MVRKWGSSRILTFLGGPCDFPPIGAPRIVFPRPSPAAHSSSRTTCSISHASPVSQSQHKRVDGTRIARGVDCTYQVTKRIQREREREGRGKEKKNNKDSRDYAYLITDALRWGPVVRFKLQPPSAPDPSSSSSSDASSVLRCPGSPKADEPKSSYTARGKGSWRACACLCMTPLLPQELVLPQPFTRMCLFRASLREKDLSHDGHGNGLMARWMRLCRFRSCERWKDWGHWSHLNGRSPVLLAPRPARPPA